MPQKKGEFSQKVCALAKTIPFGRVTTYATLTLAAGGHPMMAQMITSILSKDSEQAKIPYHRIVYANGRVWLDPKYSAKRLQLYREEGIVLDSKNRIVNFANVYYSFS